MKSKRLKSFQFGVWEGEEYVNDTEKWIGNVQAPDPLSAMKTAEAHVGHRRVIIQEGMMYPAAVELKYAP